jgi:TPR repeat protein
MYGTGTGVPQDDDEAVKWYRKAAEQGHAVAKQRLDKLDKIKNK